MADTKRVATKDRDEAPTALRTTEPESGGRSPYVPAALRLMSAWSWRLLIVAAAAVVLFTGLSYVTTVVLSLLVSLLFAALLSPLVDRLHKWRWPRILATTAVFVGTIIVVAALLGLAGQQFVTGISDLSKQAVAGFKSLIHSVEESGSLGIDTHQLTTWMNEALAKGKEALESNSGQILGGAMNVTSSVGRFVTGALITLFATFFFLLDGRKIARWLLRMLPERSRETAFIASWRGWRTLAQYARVQLVVAFVDAVGITAGALALTVPLAIPLGILVFLGAFVPLVGAIVTGIVAVLVALVAKGWIAAVIMLAVVLFVNQAESNGLQPFLMGRAVAVHPLGVVLAVAAGSMLYGVAGALFSVPVAAVANSVIAALAGRDLDGVKGGSPGHARAFLAGHDAVIGG